MLPSIEKTPSVTTSFPAPAGTRASCRDESVEIAVRVAMHVAQAETCSIDQRRMIEPVEKDVIAAADERRKHAEAGLVASGEDERRFFVEERRETCFELVVEIERPVEKPTSG